MDAKIEKKEKAAGVIKSKIEEQEKKLEPIEKELSKLKLERAEAWNDVLVEYMRSHHNQDGDSYFDSFTATIKHQHETGKPAANTFDEKGNPQGRVRKTAKSGTKAATAE